MTKEVPMTNERKKAAPIRASSFLRHWSSDFVITSRSPHTGDFGQRQDSGENIHRLALLQFRNRNGTVDVKPTRLRPPQVLEMRAAAEGLADVVRIGPDVKAFAANDREI